MTVHAAVDIDRAATGRTTPKQVLESIVNGINAGDLDALITLYEPQATFAASANRSRRSPP